MCSWRALRNELGEFQGRVKIDRVKPGSLQAHWPEINVLIPAGRLDPSGVPDYNATVEVVSPHSLSVPEEENAASRISA
jgi:hypothetical protein